LFISQPELKSNALGLYVELLKQKIFGGIADLILNVQLHASYILT